MRMATFKGEKNLSELARRLFQLSECAPAAEVERVEAALLRANPYLKDLNAVRKGAVVIVPDVEGIQPTAEARQVNAATGEIAEQVRKALPGLRASLIDAAGRMAKEGKEEMEFLESEESQRLSQKYSAYKERLPELVESAQGRIKEAESVKRFADKALAQLDEDLSELIERMK